MEKLRFTIRFVILIMALPVIMFTEMTRSDKGATEQKQDPTEKVSVKTSGPVMSNSASFEMQAVTI